LRERVGNDERIGAIVNLLRGEVLWGLQAQMFKNAAGEFDGSDAQLIGRVGGDE
jgi:hypothetical protein